MFQVNFLFLVLLCFNYVTEPHQNQNRIVGGREANHGELPFILQLRAHQTDSHVCGGFLITERYALTAAHCVICELDEVCSIPFDVMVGDVVQLRNWWSPWSQPPVTRQLIRVLRVRAHEKFFFKSVANDIAILQLEKPVILSKFVSVTSISNQPVAITKKCVTAGWGKIGFTSAKSSDHLMATKVEILEDYVCEKLSRFQPQQMICAGDLTGFKDSCIGDSGGPLICDGIAAGIVSFGHSCSVKGYGAAYTNISHYWFWINRNLLELQNEENARHSRNLTSRCRRSYFMISAIILRFIFINF